MKSKEVETLILFIKKDGSETTLLLGNRGFYTIANRRNSDIYSYNSIAAPLRNYYEIAYDFSSRKIKPKIKEYSGTSYKHFRIYTQAEAFTKD